MDFQQAKKIVTRVEQAPIYLHAYAYHLNMRLERILPCDLLDIAYEQKLKGVKIHVLDGESQSLGQVDDTVLAAFKQKAQSLQLDVHIETSASDKKTIDDAVRIAQQTGASSVRFYPRYEGHLQEILTTIANDITYIKEQYDYSGIAFTIEQHEDLKGTEIVQLIEQSGMQNLSILFDFGNMINANEQPLSALADMSHHITQVHIKDAIILKEGKGYGHRACPSGNGDMPFKALLKELICLGNEKPQVTSYGLEEEVDYYAPAFRFDDEGENPFIPWRAASETPIPENNLEQRLAKEKDDSKAQLIFVKTILNELKHEAEQYLQQHQ